MWINIRRRKGTNHSIKFEKFVKLILSLFKCDKNELENKKYLK
jgi:hypothetical protein